MPIGIFRKYIGCVVQIWYKCELAYGTVPKRDRIFRDLVKDNELVKINPG